MALRIVDIAIWIWLLAVITQIVVAIMHWRLRRHIDRIRVEIEDAKKAEAEKSTPAVARKLALAAHHALIRYVQVDIDLLERAQTDLAFLHTMAYERDENGRISADDEHACQGCPTCGETGPDLEKMIEFFRAVKANLHGSDVDIEVKIRRDKFDNNDKGA